MTDLPPPPPSLPGMPEAPAGFRWEYRGTNWMNSDWNKKIAYYGPDEAESWQVVVGKTAGFPMVHYAELVPAPPEGVGRNPLASLPPCDHDECGPLECKRKPEVAPNLGEARRKLGGPPEGEIAGLKQYKREADVKIAQDAFRIAQLQQDLTAARAALQASGWKPLDAAPRDGTVIEGLYEDGPCLIRWAGTRRCMLAGVGGGNGYFGAGWEDDYNHLIMDPPLAWREEGQALAQAEPATGAVFRYFEDGKGDCWRFAEGISEVRCLVSAWRPSVASLDEMVADPGVIETTPARP